VKSPSLAVLVTGIAIARGDLRSVDQSLVELFSRYAPIANLDDRKQVLTVRDVLTMRTGTDWNEDSYAGSPLEQLNQLQTDWLRFVIDWPMREEAGRRWQYNSGGVIALGRAIGLAAGMNTAEYARAYLLRQIGITRDKWIRGFPDLLPHTGGGLYMTSRDLARVGNLVLRRGKWNGTQVVPEAWLTESTRPLVTPTYRLGGRTSSYGYLWWLYTLDGGLPDASHHRPRHRGIGCAGAVAVRGAEERPRGGDQRRHPERAGSGTQHVIRNDPARHAIARPNQATTDGRAGSAR